MIKHELTLQELAIITIEYNVNKRRRNVNLTYGDSMSFADYGNSTNSLIIIFV